MDNPVDILGAVPNLRKVLCEMSTNDLVLASIILGREMRAAHAARDDELLRRAGGRLAAVDEELERRQMQLDLLLKP